MLLTSTPIKVLDLQNDIAAKPEDEKSMAYIFFNLLCCFSFSSLNNPEF